MMNTWNIAQSGGLLGGVTIVDGNTEKYRLRFEDLLDEGIKLSTIVVTAPADDAEISDDKRNAWFFVTPAADDEFTVTVTITTTDGQTLVYTIDFTVI